MVNHMMFTTVAALRMTDLEIDNNQIQSREPHKLKKKISTVIVNLFLLLILI